MRLIDADALETHEQLEPMGNGQYEYVEVVYKDDIDDAPTVDAIEVVRCKDCRHWHREIYNGIEYFNFNSCDLKHYGDGHNFYCADGERREP